MPQTSPGKITNKLSALQGIANTYPTGNSGQKKLEWLTPFKSMQPL
ncbi:5886_t:CDS:1, partial [Gigaspora margarita]